MFWELSHIGVHHTLFFFFFLLVWVSLTRERSKIVVVMICSHCNNKHQHQQDMEAVAMLWTPSWHSWACWLCPRMWWDRESLHWMELAKTHGCNADRGLPHSSAWSPAPAHQKVSQSQPAAFRGDLSLPTYVCCRLSQGCPVWIAFLFLNFQICFPGYGHSIPCSWRCEQFHPPYSLC